MEKKETFLSCSQVADQIGASAETVRKMAHARKLPAFAIGAGKKIKRWKFKQSDIDQWIAGGGNHVTE